ncbi:MAG: RrF2 family transcriptional regulator [Chitinophagales bacterium]|jgi:Rrf2 family protein|nr:Rrf2 family transcriptional regulator [Sphingobacteriales bacterium]
MLSKSCEYALKSILYITKHSKNEVRVGAKNISDDLGIPYHFAAKLLQILAKADIISSQKGPNGGFFLTEENLKHSLADVVRAIDGNGIFVNCILGLKTCSEIRPCPLHVEFQDIKKKITRGFEDTRLDEFQEKLLSGDYYLSNLK